MGKLLPSYKKALYDEMIDNISTGNSVYYAFAANPVPYPGAVPSGLIIQYMIDTIIKTPHYTAITIFMFLLHQIELVEVIMYSNVLIMPTVRLQQLSQT